MDGRRRVLGVANGDCSARVMVIAEAPGRFGAERTGAPLTGDQTGNNFDRLLRETGWRRAEMFITNAVLCNPLDEVGRNRPPTATELANCRDHLAATIDHLNPSLVVTLGARALATLDAISRHQLKLGAAVGHLTPWWGRWLTPLYHPGPRALIHRPLATQIEDWRRLRSTWLALQNPQAG